MTNPFTAKEVFGLILCKFGLNIYNYDISYYRWICSWTIAWSRRSTHNGRVWTFGTRYWLKAFHFSINLNKLMKKILVQNINGVVYIYIMIHHS